MGARAHGPQDTAVLAGRAIGPAVIAFASLLSEADTCSAWLCARHSRFSPLTVFGPTRNVARVPTTCLSTVAIRKQQRRVRELFNVQSIEAHREAGDQVRRAFYVDGFAQDVIAIAFVRARGKEPIVSVHFPRRNSQSPPPLVTSVPEDVWNDVLGRSRFFDRSLVPLPPTKSGFETICLHPWVHTVESTDPAVPLQRPQSVRRQTDNTCGDDLTGAYAQDLADIAVSLLTYCRELDAFRDAGAGRMLETCGKLRGDRNAAAAVMNRVEEFRREATRDDSLHLRLWFAHDAVVDLNGVRSTQNRLRNSGCSESSGSGATSRLSVDTSTLNLQHTPGSEGVVSRRQPRDSLKQDGLWFDEEARVEMIWLLNGSYFQVQHVSVGRFVEVPER